MDIGMWSLHPAAVNQSVSIRGSRCTALIMLSLRSRAGDSASQRWYSNCGNGTWHLCSLLQGTRVTFVSETFSGCIIRDGRTWSTWGKHGSNRNTVEIPWKTHMGSQQGHMGTSLTLDFKNSLAERSGAGRSATSGRWSAGGLNRVCPVRVLSGE